MAYFPAFLKFDNKKILIVGGGNIALEKLEHLLNFSSNIVLISREFSREIKSIIDINNLQFFQKDYEQNDILGFDIVIAAIDDFALQESIYFECRNKHILCNCVDLQDYCDFIFPSYIKKGELTIAISTSGSSPAFAKQFRKYLEKLVPNDIPNFLKKMREFRKTMPKGKQRMLFLEEKAKNYIESWKD